MDATASSSTVQDISSKRDDASLDVQWNFHVNALMDMLHAERAALKEERAALEKEKVIWHQAAARLEATQFAEPIVLNVGGTMFATSRETLLKLPGSYFAAMVSGRWDLQRSADGSIFIDRSPRVFGYIMDYLRGYPFIDFTSTLKQLSEEEGVRLKEECDFYNLAGLLKDISSITCTKSIVSSSLPSRLRDFFRGQTIREFTPTLLYQWSVDGPGAEKFHKKCDNQDHPTLTVGVLADGRLVGGYTSVPWSNAGGYKADSKAFIFDIPVEHNQPVRQSQIYVDRSEYAVYHHRFHGPAFGSGPDLLFNLGSSLKTGDRSSHAYQAHEINRNTPLVDLFVWNIVFE